MNVEDYIITQPNKYYISQDYHSGRIIFIEVNATKFRSNLFPDADFFIHLSGINYRVSEGHCGAWFGEGKNKRDAILSACNKLRKKNLLNGGLNKTIQKSIDKIGISPRYKVVKDGH